MDAIGLPTVGLGLVPVGGWEVSGLTQPRFVVGMLSQRNHRMSC